MTFILNDCLQAQLALLSVFAHLNRLLIALLSLFIASDANYCKRWNILDIPILVKNVLELKSKFVLLCLEFVEV